MSLADELLNDLDGLSDEGGISETEEQPVAGPSTSMGPPPVPSRKRPAEGDDEDGDEDEEMVAEGAGIVGEAAKLADGTSAVGFVGVGGVRPAEELDRDEVEGMNLKVVEDVETVVKLHKSKKLTHALERIAHFTANPSDTSAEAGPIEENPEYSLIVQANNLSVEIDNELLLIHKFIRDHYNPRFPELEQVIADPWEYIIAVESIGNAPDLTKPPKPIVGKHSLGVSMTASMSRGSLLEPRQWEVVERACKVAWELRDAREKIFAYVESRMTVLAPNLSAIISTTVAAKLLGVAGGLAAFAKAPSCNVFLFGALKKNVASSHLSAAGQNRHTGFIFQSPLVQSAAPEYRKKAQRTVASKCVLAARIDLERSSRDGSFGRVNTKSSSNTSRSFLNHLQARW